ncbi:LexA family protein [Desulfovirgula thermocuniculi]|uniref:LexA family protein n=1 Tax=Desulfovirgula thermocuniculi TaxID=348842 RepID=UPI00040989D8|nr:LexA family transcriptional regulator [Desulfovirgula thermocuniculi]
MTIGENIRKLREERGLNQRELARLAGVSHSYVSDVERGDVTPSLKFLEKVAAALGVSVSSLISRRSAQWEVIEVPVVGSVPAGGPVIEEENLLGHMPLPKEFVKGRCFALKVSGDSMQDVGIEDGDYVLVEMTHEAKNGQTVVARIRNEVTIKRFYRIDGQVRLEPANPKYRALTPSELEIIGVVRKVIKDVR